MDSIFVLWLLAGVALLVPTVAYGTKRLKPKKDYFFLILFAQSVVYLHVFPSIFAASLNRQSIALYFYLQLACLGLFEIPLLLIYLWLRKRLTLTNQASFELVPKRHLALSLVCLGFAAVFAYTLNSAGLLETRVADVDPTVALLSLTTSEFVIIRMFQETGPFLVGVLVAAACVPQPPRRRRVGLAIVALVAVPLLFNEIVNSRLNTTMTVILIGGIVLHLGRKGRGPKVASVLVLILAGALYIYKVSSNVRLDYKHTGKVTPEMFNPLHSGGFYDDYTLGERLNGIDLMALITPAARIEGFAWGAAWEGIGVATLGPLSGAVKNYNYKIELWTSPKRYLLWRYTTLRDLDYPSAILTDAYGNFGLLGFPLVAILLGAAFAFAAGSVSIHSSPARLVAGIYIASRVLTFEQQLGGLLSGLVKTLVVLIFVWFFNPFRPKVLTQENSGLPEPARDGSLGSPGLQPAPLDNL